MLLRLLQNREDDKASAVSDSMRCLSVAATATERLALPLVCMPRASALFPTARPAAWLQRSSDPFGRIMVRESPGWATITRTCALDCCRLATHPDNLRESMGHLRPLAPLPESLKE